MAKDPPPSLDLFAWKARSAAPATRTGTAQAEPMTREPSPQTTAATEPPLTVSQLNQAAKRLIEGKFSRITVVGEISKFTRPASGHCYFTLSDGRSQLSAVMFRSDAARLRFSPKVGQEVIVRGTLTIYPQRGQYQLGATSMEPAGAGALQEAFDALKAKLDSEGLFDPDRKRPLPPLPRTVGVVTSETGAVIRDIIHVATRRFPNARILLIPSLVQGPQAPASVVRAIHNAARVAARFHLDVLIVGRGGGSPEDLQAFNTEEVARAIAASPVPVVSAVGHETDFTIADFVADRRAPTPSAAAELVFPIRSELVERLGRTLTRARRALRSQLRQRRSTMERDRARLGDGRSLLRDSAQRLEDAQSDLVAQLEAKIERRRRNLHEAVQRLNRHHPRARLVQVRARHRSALDRAGHAIRQRLGQSRARLDRDRGQVRAQGLHRLAQARQSLAGWAARLDALSPLRVLERGYGIVLGPEGQALKDVRGVSAGDRLAIRLARGSLDAQVTQVRSPEGEGPPERDGGAG